MASDCMVVRVTCFVCKLSPFDLYTNILCLTKVYTMQKLYLFPVVMSLQCIFNNWFIRKRAFIEIWSTREVWRARKMRKSCSRCNESNSSFLSFESIPGLLWFFALIRSVIGPENFYHSLDQSNAKLTPILDTRVFPRFPVFSRAFPRFPAL